MPAVKTGMTPPPMPGMPAPMQPMGGMPPAQNPFAPMPPMPLAGSPQPPMPMPPMPQGQFVPPTAQGQPMQVSTAGRRRRFGDALEGMLGRNQGIGAAAQGGRSFAPAQMMPQQQMVAPGTPMMRTPTPRPMREGGIVQYMQGGGTPTNVNQYASGTRPNVAEFMGKTGADVNQAVDILYGTVGSNVDVRDWDAIMSSNNPIAAAREATRQMHTSGDLASLSTGTGQSSVPGSTGSGVLSDSGYNYRVLGNDIFLVDERGAPMAGIAPERAANFGLTQADIDQALMAAGIDMESEYARRFRNKGYDMEDYDNLLVDYSDLQRGRNQPVIYDDGAASGGGGASSGSSIVSGSGTNEYNALYGPDTSGVTATTSQFVQDPVTGELTTTNGPTMTAVSPIGAINLPARPIELDIFDYLGDPTYGSLLDKRVEGMADGGAVPRSAMIADEPHMLAYINQDEEALLRSFGGSGISGPGGIPSYPPRDLGVGATNTGKTYSGSSQEVSGGFDWDAIFEANDKPSNVTSAPTGEVDFTTIDPTTGSQTTVATIDYGDDDDGPVIKDVTYYDDTGTTEVAAPVVTTNTAYVDPNTGGVTVYDEPSGPASVYTPSVYTDRRGNQYGSQAEADAADRAFAAQLALASASVRDDAARVGLGVSDNDVDYLAGLRMDDGKVQPGFVPSSMLGGAGPAGLYSGIGGIGSGPASGAGVGVTPAPITSPDISTDVSRPDVGPEAQYDVDDLFGTGLGSDILSLQTPSAATMYPYDVPSSVLADQLRGGPLTPGMALPDAGDIKPYDFAASTISADQPLTDDDMGLPSGPVTDLQSGLGRIAARDADMDPFGTGTQLSLQDVKDRVARAEGTADEGGYGRLLGNQEGRFGVDLTNMTVQEVLDFQKQRGPGSYAEYSQGVNKQRGAVRDDGTGKISTPAGKYQVVGATLEDLIDKGVVDPNAKFDEGTQEKIGSYLIAERRGLNDLQAGNITREQFEANLGKEFEGIKRGLDKGAGSTALTIGAASETGRQVEQDRRDDNVEKIQKQIGDQAEPTGGEKLFYDFVGQLGFGLGKGFADNLRGKSREARQAIIDQHLYALQNGATPKTDEEGNYIGFDISTMDTFADKVLGAEDITKFLPGGAEDADGDGVPDYVRFGQVYDAQSTAATEDPYGMSTEQGFITEDGREFFVDATGKVVEVTDSVVPFNVGGGDDTTDIFTTTAMTDGGGNDGGGSTTTGDDTGHVNGVCNNPDYVYNPETDKCEPKKVKDDDGDLGSPITSTITPRSFDEVLRSVVVPAPDIAPISANIRPMQGGGMAGLNRAADNFLKALAG